MAIYVSKSEFKAKAHELFRQVEISGNPIIITDRGKPKLELRRYVELERSPIETLRGSVLRYDDPFEPAVPEEDWEVLK